LTTASYLDMQIGFLKTFPDLDIMKTHSILTLAAACVFGTSAHAALTAGNLLAYYNMNGQSANQFGPAPEATLGGPAALTTGNQGFSGAAGDESLDLMAAGDGSFAQTASGSHFDSLTNNNSFAVSFWQFNNANSNSSSFWLTAPDADGNERGAQAHAPWGNGTVYFDQSGCCDGPERLNFAGAGITMVNVWQHFVFQKDSLGNREIWVDGVLAASAGGGDASDPFNGVLTIGAEGPSQANSFGGRIDDMAIWNTALNPTEIGKLAGGATAVSIIPEPSSVLLGLLGSLALGLRRRR
jgi:hypothetical protein